MRQLLLVISVLFLMTSCNKWDKFLGKYAKTSGNSPTVMFRAYLSGSGYTTNFSGDVDIPLNAENYDIGNNFNTSTGKFTVPSNGYYQLNATIYLENPSSGFIHLQINKNGNTVSATSTNGGNGVDVQLSHSDLLYLEAGDVISLNLHFSGGNATVHGGGTNNLAVTYMSAFKVN